MRTITKPKDETELQGIRKVSGRSKEGEPRTEIRPRHNHYS